MTLKAALTGLTVAVLLAGTAAARRADTNLLQDGGAEAAQATGDQVVPIPGWTTTGSFTAGLYGFNGFPNAGQGPPNPGSNFFAGGPGAALSTASQTVDVSASAASIDAGTASATLDGWLGGWQTQDDSATVTAEFLAASGQALAALTIGPVTSADRGGQSKLLERTAKGNVPRYTRSIRVTITARRAEGIYNDGYADNISLTLATGPAQPGAGVATFSLYGTGHALLSARPDYIGSQIRGSGTLKLAHSVRDGGIARVTSGTGTIRFVHHFATHTERLWLAVRGGGLAGRAELGKIVLGVTASNSTDCPKGRAGFMALDDNTTSDQTDEIRLLLCGRHYFFGSEPGTSVRVRIAAE